jgi:hypothetical protein
MSFGGGAFAMLGTGSVALVSVQVLGGASFRQPVTLTISTLAVGCAACSVSSRNRVIMGRMIPPVSRPLTQNAPNPQNKKLTLRAQRVLRCTLLLVSVFAGRVAAHDLEKTQVTITFARDGSFVADVANDPDWLKLRLESVPGPFADRVVFWVDGHEIRPESAEFLPGPPAVNRMRGHLPLTAHTLRWYYGLVIDPYPLTIRRADGRMLVEEIGANAWSRTIDLSGQFRAPLVSQRVVGVLLAGLLLVPVALRIHTKRTKS